MGMAPNIGQSFLCDAEACCFQFPPEAHVVIHQVGQDLSRNAGQSHLTSDVPTQGWDESQVVEHGRTQIKREVAHLSKRLFEYFDTVFDMRRSCGTTAHVLNSVEIELDRSQDLADLIVQLARDTLALFFLGFDKPARVNSQCFPGPLTLGNIARHALYSYRCTLLID